MLDPFNASQKKPSNTPQREQIPENAHIRTIERDDLNNLQKTGKINDVSTTTAKVGETKNRGNLAEIIPLQAITRLILATAHNLLQNKQLRPRPDKKAI